MPREEFNKDDQMRVNLIEDESPETNGEVMAVMQETTIRVAMDSGAVRSVAHLSAMPAGVKITPNLNSKHFAGAGVDALWRMRGANRWC